MYLLLLNHLLCCTVEVVSHAFLLKLEYFQDTSTTSTSLFYLPKRRTIRQSLDKMSTENSAVMPFDLIELRNFRIGGGYMCPICAHKFFDKAGLRIHYRTHSGEKPFCCPHCPYRCNHSSNLNKHIYSVHTRQRFT